MNYLVDTNILIQLASRKAVRYTLVRAALKQLRREGNSLRISSQNLIEFWNVATRPVEKNGIGMNIAAATRALRMFERYFLLLPDTPLIYQEWKRLVLEYQVKGVQVHDAHLVAAMRVHSVSRILTFNDKDFARYGNEGIVAVAPNDGVILRGVRESEEQYQIVEEQNG